MKQATPSVITISRQLGCGGAYIGQALAKKLGISYADREIIRKAATELATVERTLENRDEKLLSFWESCFKFCTYSTEIYVPPQNIEPTDLELFTAESKIIKRLAEEQASVIIGRCGFFVLRDHPDSVHIFLHADMNFRIDRIRKLYDLSEKKAEQMVVQSDKDRALYCNTFTGKDWTDSRNYDLSINTSKLGVDESTELILSYMELK